MERDALSSYWSSFKDLAPFVHPDDLPDLQKSNHRCRLEAAVGEDFDSIIGRDNLCAPDNLFYFSLLPVPYVGDLAGADIFILLLNPGFGGAVDFYAEFRRPDWRQRLVRNLAQDHEGLEFPNLYLDPEFCWTAGFQWWTRKLRDVIGEIGRSQRCGGYRSALRELSRRVACIQLAPYHSEGYRKPQDLLPSSEAAQRFVRDVLLPEAEEGRITLIVTRQVRAWLDPGVKPGRGLILYPENQARSASLGRTSPGGQAILKRICPDRQIADATQ